MSNIDLDTFSKEHPLTTTLLNLSAGRDRFIEYGSGSNQLVISLSKYFRSGSAVDPSTDRQFAKLPQNIDMFSSEMSEVPINEDEYDLIILNQSLEHMLDIHYVFKRISEELKPMALFLSPYLI